MVMAGRVVWKRGRKRDFEQKDKSSGDSDTDYMAEEDEVSEGGDDSDFYCSSFEGDEIEENLNVTKVVRSTGKNASSNKKKNGSKSSRKRKRVSYKEENDDEDGENNFDDKDDKEFLPDEVDSVGEEEDVPVKRVKVSYKEAEDDEEEEEDEYDFDDEEEDDEEEFTGEELDSLDEEDDMLGKTRKTNKKKGGRRVLQKKGSGKNRKRKRNYKVVKKPSNNRVIRKYISRKKVKIIDDDDISTKNNHVTRWESREKNSRRKKRLTVNWDSDFASPGTSDNDFTISEEEREQVREAGRLCSNLTVNLRSSSLSKKIEENIDIQQQQRKAPVRKGKEKVVESVKQVCGICLSEEGKRTVCGTLNCCSHYFCYKCILEWSKVESRCPLCKQRFITISRPNDLVVQVPECNQIYQPSEEEIRGYIDPYELVICTECHEGGADNLMLLCDICDSPAHTYCVGLGQVVPEGNWYCEGCRPAVLASLNSQPEDSVPDQRTIDINIPHNRSFISENMELSLDANTIYLPFPPRYYIGDAIMASPRSGAGAGSGASTLSGRRHMHRQIRSFLSSNRTRQMGNLGSDPDNVVRLPEYPSREVGTSHNPQTGALFPPPWGYFRNQVVREPISTSEGYTHLELQSGIHLSSGQDQFPQWSSQFPQWNRSSNMSDRNVSPFALEETTQPYVQKEQVQSMVEIYLKSISGNLGLDCEIVEDIVRKSTHTILATCGLEARSSELYSLQQQPSPYCSHFERMTGRTTSLLKGHCSTCFDSFFRDIVRSILNGKLPPFLWVRD